MAVPTICLGVAAWVLAGRTPRPSAVTFASSAVAAALGLLALGAGLAILVEVRGGESREPGVQWELLASVLLPISVVWGLLVSLAGNCVAVMRHRRSAPDGPRRA